LAGFIQREQSDVVTVEPWEGWVVGSRRLLSGILESWASLRVPPRASS
jgi:hypothetical protein